MHNYFRLNSSWWTDKRRRFTRTITTWTIRISRWI